MINEALNLSTDDFVSLPSDNEITKIFTNIHYQGVVDLTKISKSNLVNRLFDTVTKVFANCTKTSFHNISSIIHYIVVVVYKL